MHVRFHGCDDLTNDDLLRLLCQLDTASDASRGVYVAFTSEQVDDLRDMMHRNAEQLRDVANLRTRRPRCQEHQRSQGVIGLNGQLHRPKVIGMSSEHERGVFTHSTLSSRR